MKIFGIGLPRTGTSSLKRGLIELGFKRGSVHTFNDPESEIYVGDWMCLPLDLYKTLDIKYPDAKFILTERLDVDTWFNSLYRWAQRRKHFKGILRQRKSMYGVEMPAMDNKKHFCDIYTNRNIEVFDYFYRKYDTAYLFQKILSFSPERGDGWKELCEFLGKDISDTPFPHRNKNKC